MFKFSLNIFILSHLLLLGSCSSTSTREVYEPTLKATEVKENTSIVRVWNRSDEKHLVSYLVNETHFGTNEILTVLGNDPDHQVSKKVKEARYYSNLAKWSAIPFAWAFFDLVLVKNERDEDTKKDNASQSVKSQSMQLSALTFSIFAYFLYKREKSLYEGISIHNKRLNNNEILTTLNYGFAF